MGQGDRCMMKKEIQTKLPFSIVFKKSKEYLEKEKREKERKSQ